MSLETSSTATPMQLLGMTHGLIIHQALYAAAKLGVADLLKDGPQTSSALARNLKVYESALCRILRLLASQSAFEENFPRTFVNTELSRFLCTPRARFRPLHSHLQGEQVLFPASCRNPLQHRDWSRSQSQGLWGWKPSKI